MPSPFVKLSDPANYIACPWDLTSDPVGRKYWVDFFKHHLATLLSHEERPSNEACRIEFFARFDAYAADPASHGRVTILTLDQWRDEILRRHGFTDPFLPMKERENQRVLPLLPAVCRELDSLKGAEQLHKLILGIFAGNIFDMGAGATAAAFLKGGPDFFKVRQSIKPRPWLIDDYDLLQARLLRPPAHRKAVFFIDNAGSDFILGAIPMMRWLAQRGTRVILAANQRPTLNDMTIDDVSAWWPRIIEIEPSLKGLAIQSVSTGTGEPLIDLSQISDELNAVSADADLVILEGMGRGVESNLDAQFSCDALNVAMIKDQAVAARHGGQLFDVICKFTPAA